MKRIYVACLMVAMVVKAQAQTSTNPLYYASGFNVFTKTALTLVSGDVHGAVATGGDLNLNGATIVAMNTSGAYPNGLNNANNYGMVVAGKINYTTGNVSYINNGYLRVGNTTGTNLYATDNNNASINLRATHGAFDASPRVEVQRIQSVSSATSASGINFTNAFNELANNSTLINTFASNGTCGNFNYLAVPATQNPHITLAANQINYLNVTQAQLSNLNNLGSIIFDNHPDATHTLIINVTGGGTYNWSTPNLGGVNESDGAYILINFPDVTSLTFSGGNSIYGSVLAPNADVYKTGANNNNGQIVSKSLSIAYGETHYFPFAGSIPTCNNVIYGTPPVYLMNSYSLRTAPLPLTAVTLKATTNNGVQTLFWNAQADNLSDTYTAERSADGKTFISIGTLNARNTAGAQDYQFTDESKSAGNAYYRIRILSKEGAVGYSNTVQVHNTITTANASVFPMPFHDVLNVKLNATGEDVQFTAILSDITGKVMVQKVLDATSNTALEGVSNLAPGIYLLRITDNNGLPVLMQKVIKE